MNDWRRSSFLFGTIDMYEKYGIQLTDDSIPMDVLLPELRPRKVEIPLRHGAYDYGAKYYKERAIQIQCVTIRMVTREESREIAYILSKKSEIRFWTEPEKYYVGRVYQAPTLEQLRNIGHRFPLTFVCEPFAYRQTLTRFFVNNRYTPEYDGTAATPTYIVLRNTSRTASVTNITITQTIKKETY